MKLYGKEWKKVEEHVGTRSSTQARSHAQKFFVKLLKKNMSLKDVLDKLDLDNIDPMLLSDDDE